MPRADRSRLNSSREPQDIQAHQSGELAAFTSDTVEHDILSHGTDEVAVYNACTDTTRHMNGVVTNMHPSEGVWLFRSTHTHTHAQTQSHHAQDQHGGPTEQKRDDPGLVVHDLRDLEEAEWQEAVVVPLLGAPHAGILHVSLVDGLHLVQMGVAQVAQQDQSRHDQRHPEDEAQCHFGSSCHPPPETDYIRTPRRGAPRANCFGSMFGDHRTCGAFPTASPPVKRQQSILVQDTAHLVRLRSARASAVPYMCFDEAYFKTLETMQWNRDNGCVELIPIVVGLP